MIALWHCDDGDQTTSAVNRMIGPLAWLSIFSAINSLRTIAVNPLYIGIYVNTYSSDAIIKPLKYSNLHVLEYTHDVGKLNCQFQLFSANLCPCSASKFDLSANCTFFLESLQHRFIAKLDQSMCLPPIDPSWRSIIANEISCSLLEKTSRDLEMPLWASTDRASRR